MGMKLTKWKDVQHKVAPSERARIKTEALAELDQMGYADLRKARSLTQVEMAERLGISQASVAGLESRTDLQLSTMAKYIRALGGELEVRAVWPGGEFNLLPLPAAPSGARKPVAKGRVSRPLKQAAG